MTIHKREVNEIQETLRNKTEDPSGLVAGKDCKVWSHNYKQL